MNTVSPRPPSAKQAGGGAVSSIDLGPVRDDAANGLLERQRRLPSAFFRR